MSQSEVCWPGHVSAHEGNLETWAKLIPEAFCGSLEDNYGRGPAPPFEDQSIAPFLEM